MCKILYFALLGRSHYNYKHISSNRCTAICYHSLLLSRNVQKYLCQLFLSYNININFYLQMAFEFLSFIPFVTKLRSFEFKDYQIFALITSYFNCLFYNFPIILPIKDCALTICWNL